MDAPCPRDGTRPRAYISLVIKLVPLLLIVLGGLAWWQLSAWSSGRGLRERSRPLKNDALEGLIGRISATAGVERVAVRVLDAPEINGLVTPAGDIYVTRGLVEEVRRGRVTPAEFASVVAHELGHLALGHTKRRAIDVALSQTVTVVVGGIIARLVPFVGWHLARMLSRLFVATLSRQDEFEADAYATAIMLRAGLGAEPQARMLEKLERLVPGVKAEGGPAGWLASHPPVGDRAAAIRANALRWSAGAG